MYIYIHIYKVYTRYTSLSGLMECLLKVRHFALGTEVAVSVLVGVYRCSAASCNVTSTQAITD